jgi:exosortase A-associated hydrolase 1
MLEQAVNFSVKDKQLIGVLHHAGADASEAIGVLIAVGGPQTRVGSHRQFVLLSRYLAANGFSNMRFDYAGMGDSEGTDADFMNVSDDIQGAIDTLKQQTGVAKVVIWGLCDAASSALIYAKKQSCEDLAGMILLNPWVRSEQGEAKAMVKHYYLNRLKDKSFWLKILSFKFNTADSFASLKNNLLKMSVKKPKSSQQEQVITTDENYISHMLLGLQHFDLPIMLVISGDDLTASEFLDLVKSSQPWQQQIAAKVNKHLTIPAANHTFSSKIWRQEVEHASLLWLQNLNEQS